MPYSAIQLCTYEAAKKGLRDADGKLSIPARLTAGALAGMTATLVWTPPPEQFSLSLTAFNHSLPRASCLGLLKLASLLEVLKLCLAKRLRHCSALMTHGPSESHGTGLRCCNHNRICRVPVSAAMALMVRAVYISPGHAEVAPSG